MTSNTPQALTIESVSAAADRVGGNTHISEDVVASLAQRAAANAEWIHSLGKPRFFGFGWRGGQAIAVEVGTLEAAVDLEVVVRYGCDIRQVVAELRQRIGADVDRMCGRELVEVNVRVVGVHLDKPTPTDPAPRRGVR